MEHERDSKLRLSKERKEQTGEVVDRIKTTIERESGMDVHNVYKSGSIKKGTALESNADVDLVLCCNTDKSTAEFGRTTKPEYMNRLRSMPDKGAFNWAESARVTDEDSSHLEMSVKHKGTPVKVDFTVSRNPPTDQSEGAMRASLDAMRLESKETQKQFNLEHTQQQTDVIKGLPPKVKDVIRDVKEWKRENDVPVKSYCVELDAKHNWEQMGGGDNFDRGELRGRMFKDFADAPTMNVTKWKDTPSWQQQYVPKTSGPVMADPVNPLDNVAPSAEKAKIVARAARKEYPDL